MSYLKSLGTSVVYVAFFLAVITFMPGLPPDVPFTEYSIKPPVALTGVLAPNDLLNKPEFLLAGEIRGPESFASYNGDLYFGLEGGIIARLLDKRIIPLVRFGEDCEGRYWQPQKCGRPLGMKFDKQGFLYVADAYLGIFKLHVGNTKHERLFDPSQPIDGKVPKIFNSIDLASNGDVYWTDSSTDFQLNDGIFTMFADPAGRLIRYNAATKKNEVLLKNLGFANGVKLSHDESYVLVAETMKSTIVKYHLKGAKAGKSELLFEGLPGLPDNIHSDGLGNYLVALVLPADPEHPQLSQTLIPHPFLRKMVARLLGLLELPFKLLQLWRPSELPERFLHLIGSFESFSFMYPNNTTVLRFTGDGKILNALHNSDEKMGSISSAFINGNFLWLGSPYNDYLARVPLKQAFPDVSFVTKGKNPAKITREDPPKVVQRVETPKPTTTTPKPTTTTQKPTTTTPRPTTTTTTPRPTTTTPKPTTTKKPATTTKKPTTTTKKPTTTTPRPTTTTQKPTQAPPKPVKVEQVKQVKPTPEIHVQHQEQKHAQHPPSQEFSREVFNDEPPRREQQREETDEFPRPIEVDDRDVPVHHHQAGNVREPEPVRHDHHDEM